jgi:Uma2 family endonuclease
MTAPIAFGDVEEDQHVILRDMSWEDFEGMLAIRGDRPGVRMYYLDGEIELMSPARTHEDRKTTLARLLEVWALESDLVINGFGSWTLKQRRREAGGEPDECYILGDATHRDTPELVIEVEWSRRLGLQKREIIGASGCASCGRCAPTVRSSSACCTTVTGSRASAASCFPSSTCAGC